VAINTESCSIWGVSARHDPSPDGIRRAIGLIPGGYALFTAHRTTPFCPERRRLVNSTADYRADYYTQIQTDWLTFPTPAGAAREGAGDMMREELFVQRARSLMLPKQTLTFDPMVNAVEQWRLLT